MGRVFAAHPRRGHEGQESGRAEEAPIPMAMGNPEPRRAPADYLILDDVLSEDTCIVCKRRPRETGHGLCGSCDAALHART